MTAHVDVWMAEEMKKALESLRHRLMNDSRHRLSLSDLGRESFEDLLKKYERR